MGPNSSSSRRSLRSVTSNDSRAMKSVLKGSPCQGGGGRGAARAAQGAGRSRRGAAAAARRWVAGPASPLKPRALYT